MMQSKFKKAIFSIILILMMIVMAGQNVIYAVKNETIYIGYQSKRVVDGKEVIYTIGSDITIYKMIKTDGNDTNPQTLGTNFYCIKGALDPGLTYTNGYDMITEKDLIAGLTGEHYDVYRETVSDNIYIPLMWIFDHMYDKDTMTVDEMLTKIGIVSNPVDDSIWYYAREYGYGNVRLEEEEIEAVQQAAIWYFTNYDASDSDTEKYNVYTPAPASDSYFTGVDAVGSWFQNNNDAEDTTVKLMKREQAAILCNYLIDNAKEALEKYNADKEHYDINNSEASLEFIYTDDNKTIAKEGQNYVIGPVKLTITGEVEDLSLEVTTGDNEIIDNSIVTLRDKDESDKTYDSLPIGKEFYVVIPIENVNGSVKLKVNANKTVTTKTLWVSHENDGSTQPVVEYDRKKVPINVEPLIATPKKLFDLALRKEIIKVNDKTTFRSEQFDSATRNIDIHTDTIPVTATYKHRKDPVVVNTNDTVTYRIHIYNEGDIDGYASKIVDRLADGLELVEGITEVTSKIKNNEYDVSYDSSTHEITFTIKSSTTPEAIKAYEGGNNLDEDYIEITCKVTQEAVANAKHYLSNVAYIAEAKDSEGNTVERDRDNTESSPTNTTGIPAQNVLNVTEKSSVYHGKNEFNVFDNTSDTYFAGQEDDDDFETVVVLPKEFDLKLMKNISKINEDDVDEDVRKLTVENYENLKPYGELTTANYQVKKAPIMVKKDDLITYTLTIYNEGELDGYAKEISEDIPEGLEFVKENQTNINYEWVMYDENGNVTEDVKEAKVLKTAYLSKAKSSDENLLHAFDGEHEPDSKTIQIVLKVTATDITKIYRNEAAITKHEDKEGNEGIKDRDSHPDEWNKEDSDECYDGPEYPKYKEDDEDYDNIRLARFDIALRKFISKVTTDANGNFNDDSNTTSYDREPFPVTNKINTIDPETGKVITTATYNHSKEPIVLNVGDYVLYTIRVYNEGDTDGYATEITDYLPEYLDFVTGTNFSINSVWTQDPQDAKIVKTNALAGETLTAFDGTNLDFADVQIICKVNENALSNQKITNFAKITQYADEDNNPVNEDIDSKCDDTNLPSDFPTYKDEEIERGDRYIPGFEDDDDFEKVIVRGPGKYDVILIKEDENGEDLNSKATFEVNGETKEVTGRLIIADDVVINASNVNTPDVYTIKETIPPDDYCTFDGIITITVNKKIDGNTYSLDGEPVYVVKDKDGNDFDTTDAKVYVKDGNIYVEVVDHEEKEFDLALRKFITNISGEDVTTRIPSVSYENGKITYTHPKDVVTVHVDDIVTYTLRVFNEGELDGYAEKISDDIPEYLEFLPEHETNKEYRWVMLDKDGKETTDVKEAVRIMTDYTSRANGAEKNLLKAFNPNAAISDTNPAHLDVKVAFKVKDPNSNKYVIVNKAQISEDADENGNPIDDIDSIPDKWNDGEDDQDYENVKVEYFDLALLKYVTKVIVTDNGKTTSTNTGNTGADTDIMPKVEIHKKRVKTTIVKFEYTIKITNEGDIAGYAKEITDYVPNGLKFYAADNTGWKDEGNNVISTKLLENTLLQPGESATVKVILRWINGENNLQTKINIAEISEDYNDKDIPDRDSTPDNKKEGEDDIDDAPVILGIKTGLTENIMMYIGVSLVILITLGTGVLLIKKFVL